MEDEVSDNGKGKNLDNQNQRISGASGDELELVELLGVIIRKRKFIIYFTLIATLLAVMGLTAIEYKKVYFNNKKVVVAGNKENKEIKQEIVLKYEINNDRFRAFLKSKLKAKHLKKFETVENLYGHFLNKVFELYHIKLSSVTVKKKRFDQTEIEIVGSVNEETKIKDVLASIRSRLDKVSKVLDSYKNRKFEIQLRMLMVDFFNILSSIKINNELKTEIYERLNTGYVKISSLILVGNTQQYFSTINKYFNNLLFHLTYFLTVSPHNQNILLLRDKINTELSSLKLLDNDFKESNLYIGTLFKEAIETNVNATFEWLYNYGKSFLNFEIISEARKDPKRVVQSNFKKSISYKKIVKKSALVAIAALLLSIVFVFVMSFVETNKNQLSSYLE